MLSAIISFSFSSRCTHYSSKWHFQLFHVYFLLSKNLTFGGAFLAPRREVRKVEAFMLKGHECQDIFVASPLWPRTRVHLLVAFSLNYYLFPLHCSPPFFHFLYRTRLSMYMCMLRVSPETNKINAFPLQYTWLTVIASTINLNSDIHYLNFVFFFSFFFSWERVHHVPRAPSASRFTAEEAQEKAARRLKRRQQHVHRARGSNAGRNHPQRRRRTSRQAQRRTDRGNVEHNLIEFLCSDSLTPPASSITGATRKIMIHRCWFHSFDKNSNWQSKCFAQCFDFHNLIGAKAPHVAETSIDTLSSRFFPLTSHSRSTELSPWTR